MRARNAGGSHHRQRGGTTTDPEVRILFIPDAPDVATSERTPTMLRTLRERYPVVTLAASWDRLLYDTERPRWVRALLYAIDKVVLAARGLLLARRFRAQLVFCESAHHAVAGLGIARILGIRCAWDSHGNGRLFYEGLGKGRWSVRLVTALERFLGRRVDDLITVSAVDAAAYEGMGLTPQKIHVIPLFLRLAEVDSAATTPPRADGRPREGRAVLLFFGSFRYEPNREALRFINERLAPRLEALGMPCEIRVAGRDVPADPLHPLVRNVGFVPDIHAAIREADVCIVPVARGVGMLTKVLDAMAAGTPMVLTEFAARGIPELRHGVHAYIAADAAEFERYVAEALSHPEAARAMAREARLLAERRFDGSVYRGELDAILRGVPRPTGGVRP